MPINKITRRCRKYFCVIVLWLVFCAGCLLAPLLAMLLPLCDRNVYLRNFIMAADRMMAAILGFSGNLTMSTEFAHSSSYAWIRKMLNVIEPTHCEVSAINEQAYCKLSDGRLGNK